MYTENYNSPRGEMAGAKQGAARPGRATGLKKQKSMKSPRAPPKEANNAPRFSFGKKSSNPEAPPSNKGLAKKNQSLSRSRATSPRVTRPTTSTRAKSPNANRYTASARPTSPKISRPRPTNIQAKAPAKPRASAKPRTAAKPKPTIKTARGNPFGSDASSSSGSAESSYAGGVVPLPSPPRTSSRTVPQKETSMASPRAASRSRHVQNSAISPTNNTRRNRASNLSITSSNLGVVPIAPSPKPAEKVEEKKKKRSKKPKSTAKEKTEAPNKPSRAKIEEEEEDDDDKSEHSQKSFAQSITESILPFLVKKTKKQDSGIRDNAPAKAKNSEKKMEQKEEQNGCMNNDDEASHQHDHGSIAKEAEQSSNESSNKETDIHQDDDQGEHHHHRRVHAAFRGAPSTDESQLLPEGDSKLDANIPLIDNIKRIETPSNAATLHKVMMALQTERENAFDAKCQLREALAELDKVKRDFSNAKESYSTENYRLNNKLTRMMDRIEQLEHEMAMSGKNFVYATFEGEPEYKSAASPSTKYGARSPRAVRLSKIPWACVDTSAFSFMNPCGGGTEERGDVSSEQPANSLVTEEEAEEGEAYFSRPSSELVPRE